MTDYSHLLEGVPHLLEGETDSKTGAPYTVLELHVGTVRNGVNISERWVPSFDDPKPADVRDGRVRRFLLARGPCVVDVEKLARDLTGGRLARLIDRIRNGLTLDQNELIGFLTADASRADVVLSARLATNPKLYVDTTWNVWDEESWFYEHPVVRNGITAKMSDLDISDYLEEVRAEARRDKALLTGSAFEMCADLRDRMRKEHTT